METLKTAGDTSWFVNDRFGMFIHWGLYALGAHHEWLMNHKKMSPQQYRKYFDHFDPDLYDPAVWADAAAHAGMKYFVITTKHHEGFCLWDSALTDYKVTNTPYGRDLLRPMVNAFNERGLRTGFYHSLIDWHHSQYVLDHNNHPQRDDPDFDKLNEGRDQQTYIQYLHDQVRELLTQFGPVDVLWFDFSFAQNKDHPRDDFRYNKGREAWGSEDLLKLIRQLQPQTLLTNRLDLDLPLAGGDFLTPEQAQPRQWVTTEIDGKKVPVTWEACQTFSGSWGYHRDEHDWRSVRQLITTLIDCVSKGGNLLLNVGPTGRGEIDARALDRLKGIGKWMHHHSRSIYGCTQAPAEFPTPQDTRLTYNPQTNRLYVHVLNWPYRLLHLDGQAYRDRVAYAQLLNDASEVTIGMDAWHSGQIGQGTEGISINLPQREIEGVEIPVIELFLR